MKHRWETPCDECGQPTPKAEEDRDGPRCERCNELLPLDDNTPVTRGELRALARRISARASSFEVSPKVEYAFEQVLDGIADDIKSVLS